jgi:hypothetical protein
VSQSDLVRKLLNNRKDLSNLTPMERKLAEDTLRNYEEPGIEEGDFSDYVMPVKGMLQKGAKGIIRRMAEKGPPDVKTAKGIVNQATGGRTQQEAVDFIKEEGFDSIGKAPVKLPTGVLRKDSMKAPGAQTATKQVSKDGYGLKTEAFEKMAKLKVSDRKRYEELRKQLTEKGKKQFE